MMDLNPGLMLWTIVSFVLFFLILKKFAWKPILAALDAREKGINDNIEASRKARAEAEQALAQYTAKLNEAAAEAQNLVAKARRDAEKVREELLAKSKLEAEAQVESARRRIELESQEAIRSIRDEIAVLVVASAERVIGRELNPQDHERLIHQSLEEQGK